MNEHGFLFCVFIFFLFLSIIIYFDTYNELIYLKMQMFFSFCYFVMCEMVFFFFFWFQKLIYCTIFCVCAKTVHFSKIVFHMDKHSHKYKLSYFRKYIYIHKRDWERKFCFSTEKKKIKRTKIDNLTRSILTVVLTIIEIEI